MRARPEVSCWLEIPLQLMLVQESDSLLILQFQMPYQRPVFAILQLCNFRLQGKSEETDVDKRF